ncbi:L-threonylcarbamoyladenylate synthase [Lusitaniella coriacea LEGE 07157]|uniref:L-threonylcarbamoyladenylate synthase n=1 Tax=Lusitaniella coriacea LEGE 07157 TaxID=945747 RepID=A0A8J7JBG3_9CYAN|nr:L-threonylcarbamoyladenylate synthase [Lusitaniella coriacea]MBE9116835.1 L-threonylcarbamoyladenylate synthase [Lusitaniella coriacea LEGE 07157]
MTQVSQTNFIEGAIAGNVISFPTDTVPALAVRPDNATAIFTLKQRAPEKPLILMAAAWRDLQPYLTGTPDEFATWEGIVQRYWPGALTLVLPASPSVPPAMNPLNPETIGVRVPNSDIALALLAKTGPLATTSANRSGESPLETMAAIEAAFDERVLIPNDVPGDIKLGSGLPSTVVRWMEGEWTVLRQGSVRLI